ncbi:unnamed protein product, partial [Brenthis ino]
MPVIEITLFGGIYETFETAGAPTNPFFYPLSTRHRLNDLTLWEISELQAQYNVEQVYAELAIEEDHILKRMFGLDVPEVKELRKNVQMLFLNVHPLWDFIRPVSADPLFGWLQPTSSEQLPQKLHTIMLDPPQTPLERAVWWTEYVLRHSDALYLRFPAAAHMH